MFRPSEEQALAIEANGGLLEAGAGSGKTFVIVEHVFHRIGLEVRDKQSGSPPDAFARHIRSVMRSIVVITFTTKAARELFQRMKARIPSFVEQYKLESFQDVIEQSLQEMMIGTIHGMCSRLLKDGVFPEFSHFEMATELGIKRKVEKSFERHFASVVSRFSFDVAKVAWERMPGIRTMMTQILGHGRPPLSNWPKTDIWKSLLECYGVNLNVVQCMQVQLPDKLTKAWEKNCAQLLDLRSDLDLSTLDGVDSFCQVLDSIRLSRPRTNKEASEWIGELARLKAWYRACFPDLRVDDDDTILQEWQALINALLGKMKEDYQLDHNISFSDLEERTLTGLQRSPQALGELQKVYKYFIVDEFQDTSQIQLDIFLALTSRNRSSLFCVGDPKQAIYGFRGGDLSLYHFARDYFGEDYHYFLKDNYRSSRCIVESNNRVFKDVLDADVDSSQRPLRDGGEVVCLSENLDKKANFDQWESLALVDYLDHGVRDEHVGVLYLKLAPSFDLISRLLKTDLGLRCQLKFELRECPPVALFTEFLKWVTGARSHHHGQEMLGQVNRYLHFWNLSAEIDDADFQRFYHEYRVLGIYPAFLSFLRSIGISFFDSTASLSLIEGLCQHFGEYDQILTHLQVESSRTVSIQFDRAGRGKIEVMSVHASKGLQFDWTVLGGVSTNGSIPTERRNFGGHPSSFRYYHPEHGPVNTPEFLLERQLSIISQRHERNRLLYVACTRAKERIIIAHPENVSDLNEHCWARLLSNYGLLATEIRAVELSSTLSSAWKAPPQTVSHLGVASILSNLSKQYLQVDLSVTGLAQVMGCPRRFYLSQVMNIETSEVSKVVDFLENRQLMMLSGGSGAKDRGTKIHRAIERFLVGGDSSGLTIDLMTWISSCRDRWKGTVHVEQDLKFDFHGRMISGRPDVWVQRQSDALIVDFKTGDSDKLEQVYWAQLHLYAYGLNMLFGMDSFELQLLNVDKQTIESKTVSLKQVLKLKDQVLGRLENLFMVDDLCRGCPHPVVCQDVLA